MKQLAGVLQKSVSLKKKKVQGAERAGEEGI